MPHTLSPQRKRIGVYLKAVRSEDRECLRGLAAFSTRQPHWDFQIEEQSVYDASPFPPRNLDAILVRLDQKHPLNESLTQDLPGVNLSESDEQSRLPRVCNDNRMIGIMAAEHFLARGYEHFAVFGRADHYGLSLRHKAFYDTVHPQQRSLQRYEEDEQVFDDFSSWVQQVDAPVALFCCSSHFARSLIEHCRRKSWHIPERVAILGGTEDDLICSFSSPRLSSVQSNAYRIGYAAGASLAKQLAGEKVEPELRIPPMGVISRRSTDMLAVTDRALVTALHYIRDHYPHPISCDQIADAAGLSRRSLDRKCAQILGRSISEEIRRVRIEAAKSLLVSSEDSLQQISELCGYEYPERFSIVFKRITGKTPTRYRAQFRE